MKNSKLKTGKTYLATDTNIEFVASDSDVKGAKIANSEHLYNEVNYKVFVAPSSDTERFYEECETIEQAEKIAKSKGDGSEEVFVFETEAELNAFIKGYTKAIGYLGDGFFIKTSRPLVKKAANNKQ